jgi:hypothetical protein
MNGLLIRLPSRAVVYGHDEGEDLRPLHQNVSVAALPVPSIDFLRFVRRGWTFAVDDAVAVRHRAAVPILFAFRSSLEASYISKANAKQRAGRAGPCVCCCAMSLSNAAPKTPVFGLRRVTAVF